MITFRGACGVRDILANKDDISLSNGIMPQYVNSFLHKYKKGARIGIYEPTVDLLKRIIYPRFEDIFANSGLRYKLNKSDGIMQVWMPNGLGLAEIIFRSMENPSRIIGYETHHAILDEIDTIPSDKAMEVWIKVIARNRKKFYVGNIPHPTNPNSNRGKNTVGVTTTPEGYKFVYTMWVKQHKDNPDYRLIRGKTTDNYHLHPDYVPTLRATYPAALIEAYINGEFVNMVGNTVYGGFNRQDSHTDITLDNTYTLKDTLKIGMDFNVGRMAAVVIMPDSDYDAPKNQRNAYAVDEFHDIHDTPAMIIAIRNRYPDYSIEVFPDASGRSRKSVDASKSDIRLLRDAGFRVNAPKKNPPVRERVLSVDSMFLNGENARRLFVNTTKCPHLTEQLEKQIYDNGGAPLKDGNEDINDALGYVINRLWGLARPKTVIGRMRVGA